MSATITQANISLPAEQAENLYKKVFWRFVPFIMLCYVVAYLDRVNVGFAKLQMSQDLNFSETIFGLGAGIFFLGYFLFELPSNLIMNRVGAKLWIARIMITWGILSACFAWVQTPTQFYVLRFLLGLAEAGFYPGIILYLTYWFPSHRRAKVVATFMAAIPVSGIFGNPLSGWIMQSFHGSSGWHGWQWMFMIEAIPAILVGIAVFFVMDNSIRKAKWLTESEKDFLEAEIRADQKDKQSPKSTAGVFKDIRIWHMCLIYFCIVMGQYGLTFWLPTLVKASGVVGDFKIGLISAIPFVCAVFAMILIGRRSDRLRERRWHLIVPALLGAVGFVISAIAADNTMIAIAFLSLAAMGVLTCSPLFWSLPTAFLSGTGAAAGIAVINSVGNLAGFVSPFLVGWLKDTTHNNQTGMFMLAGMLVIGAIAILKTPPKMVNR
ncbi:MFS transporter [Collimonas silvisoli]|uniref:MFS transporter n=1 Tax=Collimonas silvisoli TaxID=2825884 RepID=UPI001B8ABCE2|nr:MFS transporter [Collimonas silvisoli]